MATILLTGGTGFIGSELVRELLAEGHKVTLLSRNPVVATNLFGTKIQSVAWDFSAPLTLAINHDHVIHLAGEPIFGRRWNTAFKAKLRNSRIESTRRIVEAMGKAKTKPHTFLCASAVGYYGDRGDERLDEKSSGVSDFLGELCSDWEKTAEAATALGIRVVRLRIGIVLGSGGGALKAMLPPFKAGMGGPLSHGDQWMSWIHLKDVTAAIRHAVSHPGVKGAVNLVSPSPVKNKEFAHTLGAVLHRPAFLPIPRFALKLVVGEVSAILTASQRVHPQALLDSGFKFRFSDLRPALDSLV